MTFLYGLLTATGAIILAQTFFNYTLNLQFIYQQTLGRLVNLFKKEAAKL